MRRAGWITRARYALLRHRRLAMWYWVCVLAWLEEQAIRRRERKVAAGLAAHPATYGREAFADKVNHG